MPQIDVPFLPGDKVRVRATGEEVLVRVVWSGRAETTFGCGDRLVWFGADELEDIKPVIEWRYVHANVWESADKRWRVSDAGTLAFCGQIVGRFANPRAVAEETQRLWNERAVSNEGEGK